MLRPLMLVLVALSVVATAVDAILWGRTGLVATGLGSLAVLAVVYFALARRDGSGP